MKWIGLAFAIAFTILGTLLWQLYKEPGVKISILEPIEISIPFDKPFWVAK